MTPDHISLFIVSSQADTEHLQSLLEHIKPLEYEGLVNRIFHDATIEAGANWEQSIRDNLAASDVILLLVSSDFMASEQCYKVEMLTALKLNEQGTARTVPVILRPCLWEDSPFAKLKVLPRNGVQPIISDGWDAPDTPYVETVRDLKNLILELKGLKKERYTRNQNPQDDMPKEEKKTYSLRIFGIPIISWTVSVAAMLLIGIPLVLNMMTNSNDVDPGTDPSNFRNVNTDTIDMSKKDTSATPIVKAPINLEVYQDKVTKKYGYADKLNRDTIPAIYDEALVFKRGLAAVRMKKTWGVIDQQGTDIIANAFDKIITYEKDTILVSLKGKQFKYSRSGERLK